MQTLGMQPLHRMRRRHCGNSVRREPRSQPLRRGERSQKMRRCAHQPTLPPLLLIGEGAGRSGLSSQVAAVVEQVEHQRLLIVLDAGRAARRHAVSQRKDALGDAQVRLIHEA